MLPYKGKDVINSRILTWGDYPRVSRWILNSIISVFYKWEVEGDFTQQRKREKERKRKGERRKRWEDRGRAWNDTATSQGTLKNASNHQTQRTISPPEPPKGSMDLLTPWFQNSGLQNWDNTFVLLTKFVVICHGSYRKLIELGN